jgi:hypothetical protein
VPVPNLAVHPVVLSLAEHLVVPRAVSLAAPQVVSKRVVLRPVALPGVLVAKVPRQVWPLVLAVVLVAHHKIVVGLWPKRVAVRAPKRHRAPQGLLV